MGFKTYWDVFKLSRFRKELFAKNFSRVTLRFVCHASMLAPYSQSGNEAMQPVLVWGQDTNTLPGPISRFRHRCTS